MKYSSLCEVIFLNKQTWKAAFPYTVPVLMGYLSIGLVFGWMLSSIGYMPLWSVAMSLSIYAGSGQYLGVDLLANASPLADAAFLTLVINFRHLVYGLSMLDKFQNMGLRKLYMIFSLTDETYALLAGVQAPDGVEEKDFYTCIALLNHSYWVLGSLLGAVAGSLITINTEGIDFAMTALFLVIAVEQWKSSSTHFPAVLGVGGTLLSLLVMGPEGGRFLIPALGLLVGGLLLARPRLTAGESVARNGGSLP